MNLLLPNVETISVHIDSVNTRLLMPDVGVLKAGITFVFKVDGKEMTANDWSLTKRWHYKIKQERRVGNAVW
jgi:hypothetical protein